MRMNIIEMWCVHGARDNLLSLTTKWTGPMLYNSKVDPGLVHLPPRLKIIKVPAGV